MGRQRILCVVTVVAALVAATPAFGQRLSLAERVTLLENKANVDNQSAGQANLEMQNRVTQLQSEVQSLRNQVETLTYELEQLRQRNRDQYVDIDGRLARLEGGEPVASAPSAPAASQSPAAAPAPAAAAANPPAPATAAATADPAGEQAAYQAALDLLINDFEADRSARLFQDFIRDYPQSSLVPNAWYWLGESYYVTQNYELAVEAFQALLAQHPGSRKEGDALLKLGYCQLALGQRAAGEASLREVPVRFPGTDSAAKAEARLRTLALENR
ncbi:MAG: tol-pal system protein YbgF [Arenimonas sp. SCN 70-307]|uniref:tol-pal system protein YbgF n=1 Tax=Arenimonas sp. SCN 70-307 TaxID=1660089 RepID=UPI00086DF72C|nr:tol-pal system protein YbgF [Arenimonas sp. SCN 70-307]ODS63053.1 MAG: tol-pal system protein YbgF [Arenimonas sp. SCN 70-307]